MWLLENEKYRAQIIYQSHSSAVENRFNNALYHAKSLENFSQCLLKINCKIITMKPQVYGGFKKFVEN